MKKDTEIYTSKELEAVSNIEKDNYEPLSKKDFEKEKNRFQQMANNTLKRKSIQ